MSKWLTNDSEMMFDSFLQPPAELSTETEADSVQLYTTVKDGKKKNFVCTAADCLKVFRFKSEIERHIFTHSQSRPFLCPFEGCARAFKRTNALQNHVRSQHTGEASLSCPYPDCNLSFTTTAKLRYHKALHLSEKPYKCSFEGCGRSFVTFSQLKQHEKSPSVHIKKEQFAENKPIYQRDAPCQSSLPIKKIKAEAHPGRYSQPPHIAPAENEAPSYLYMQDPYPMQEPITIKRNEEESGSVEGETHRLENVLTENQILRKELESSESLINRIKGGLGQAALAMFDEIQKMVTNKYNSNFMRSNDYQEEEPSETTVKDVDSYFFENDGQNLGYLYEDHPFSASCEETSVHSEQDMFGNYTCENLSTLLFGKHDRL